MVAVVPVVAVHVLASYLVPISILTFAEVRMEIGTGCEAMHVSQVAAMHSLSLRPQGTYIHLHT